MVRATAGPVNPRVVTSAPHIESDGHTKDAKDTKESEDNGTGDAKDTNSLMSASGWDNHI